MNDLNFIVELRESMRVADTPSGMKLRERQEDLYRATSRNPVSAKFWEELNEKVLTEEQMLSEEWKDVQFAVMRHSLRCTFDREKAWLVSKREQKVLHEWPCKDFGTITGSLST